MPHSTLMWGTLAAISVSGLLVSFERVVQQGVRQGESRRAAVLERSNAAWRCAALPQRKSRDDCRLALR